MSQPEYSVVLSPLARRDFEDIQIYTLEKLEKWGERQRKKYAALIFDGLKNWLHLLSLDTNEKIYPRITMPTG